MTGGGGMAERRVLILGGCGFIGSNFIQHLHQQQPETHITIFDLLTYAGSLDNLGELTESPSVDFVQGDLAEADDFAKLSDNYDLAINFAAETHVDRSLYDADRFVRSNVLGVVNLLLWCRERELPLLQISTDEVYGPARDHQSFDETAPLNPTSPYAASKGAADLMVQTAVKTFGQQAAIVRTCNNYGPRQYPEKLIPFCIHRARQGLALPLYGNGRQRRCWLRVEDFCAALLRVIADFPTGEVINIGSDSERENVAVVEQIRQQIGGSAEIEFVADRPGHDHLYRISSAKFVKRYGEIPQRAFESGLRETIDWYQANPGIFQRLSDSATQTFFEQHYQQPDKP
ncbi:MAG: GDP-mannose 4,6-dehydratase [bacterium]